MRKMTYSEALDSAISILGDDIYYTRIVERLIALKYTLDKRNTVQRKEKRNEKRLHSHRREVQL